MKKIYKVIIVLIVISIIPTVAFSQNDNNTYKLKYNDKIYSTEKVAIVNDGNYKISFINICKLLNIDIKWINDIENENKKLGHYELKNEVNNIRIYSRQVGIINEFSTNVLIVDEFDMIDLDDTITLFGKLGYYITVNDENFLIEINDINPISLYINNELIENDLYLLCSNNNILLPMRKIFEKFGATVEWERNMIAVASYNNNTYSFIINDDKYKKMMNKN